MLDNRTDVSLHREREDDNIRDAVGCVCGVVQRLVCSCVTFLLYELTVVAPMSDVSHWKLTTEVLAVTRRPA